MKISTILILLICFVLMSTLNAFGQETPSAAQTAGELRAQLLAVQGEEADLQRYAEQLDWDLKPENIERYFAGTGSTRPEELREQRRRQLQNEKDRVLARLAQLAASRTRLEAAIIAAEAAAYQESAQDPLSRQVNQMLGAQYLTTARLMIVALVFIAILGALSVFAIMRLLRQLTP